MSPVEIGAAGTPFDVVVERGKIREFAAATRASGESWHEDPAPVSPPTFLTADRFWASPGTAALGGGAMNWARILHGEQEFVFHGPPPRAGARLTACQFVENTFEKQGKRGGVMSFTVVLTEYRDADRTLVAEARSTVIETSQAAGS